MKHLIIIEMNILNEEWIPQYTENVTPMVELYGGKYLARTPEIKKLEGNKDLPQFSVVVEFPSKEAAEKFYNSAEYLPYKQSRQEGSESNILLLPLEG